MLDAICEGEAAVEIIKTLICNTADQILANLIRQNNSDM